MLGESVGLAGGSWLSGGVRVRGRFWSCGVSIVVV